MRRPNAHLPFLVLPLVLMLMLMPSPAPAAEVLSKSYVFKYDVTLEMGVATEAGLRLDSVRFEVPTSSGQPGQRTGGLVRAEIKVSNVSRQSHKFGLALALFDAEKRLVGVASGARPAAGSHPASVRPVSGFIARSASETRTSAREASRNGRSMLASRAKSSSPTPMRAFDSTSRS